MRATVSYVVADPSGRSYDFALEAVIELLLANHYGGWNYRAAKWQIVADCTPRQKRAIARAMEISFGGAVTVR